METDARRRTISDLAELLGVSSMTIHRAISGKPDISPATRDRILAEIERLGWRPNIAARGLRQGKTYTIGILVSNVAASFLPEILQGVGRAADEQGYHTFVSVHEHDPARAERHLQTMQSKGVDGIVHYPTEAGGEAATLREVARTTPVVLIMRGLEEFEGPSAVVDDRLAGRIAAEHLLRLGHRTFGYLGYEDSTFSRQRREGFEQALRAAGLALRPEWTATDLRPGGQSAPEAATRILALRERPGALFCGSDRLAARAMQAALALGLRVPADLSVIGCNGDPWGHLLAVPLTTVAQPRLELGERAAHVVLSSDSAADAEQIVLNPSLVVRESTGPAPRHGARAGSALS